MILNIQWVLLIPEMQNIYGCFSHTGWGNRVPSVRRRMHELDSIKRSWCSGWERASTSRPAGYQTSSLTSLVRPLIYASFLHFSSFIWIISLYFFKALFSSISVWDYRTNPLQIVKYMTLTSHWWSENKLRCICVAVVYPNSLALSHHLIFMRQY